MILDTDNWYFDTIIQPPILPSTVTFLKESENVLASSTSEQNVSVLSSSNFRVDQIDRGVEGLHDIGNIGGGGNQSKCVDINETCLDWEVSNRLRGLVMSPITKIKQIMLKLRVCLSL